MNVDNKGLTGIERMLDETGKVEPVLGVAVPPKAPIRLSLDVGVQHAVGEELQRAVQRYVATAAAGLVLDVTSGRDLWLLFPCPMLTPRIPPTGSISRAPIA